MIQSAGAPRLSIVLPTWNEAENLRALIPEIEDVFAELDGGEPEVLVVDDRSTDGTDVVCREMSQRYPGVRLIARFGPRSLSGAWLDGFRAANGAWIASMDADGAHDPRDLVAMLNAGDEADVVIGSRYMTGDRHGMAAKPRLHRWASRLGGRAAGAILGLRQTDVTHGFRVFRREVFEAIGDELNAKGNALLIEFLARATARGFRIREVPIVYRERGSGESKLRVLRESARAARTSIALRHLLRPARRVS